MTHSISPTKSLLPHVREESIVAYHGAACLDAWCHAITVIGRLVARDPPQERHSPRAKPASPCGRSARAGQMPRESPIPQAADPAVIGDPGK